MWFLRNIVSRKCYSKYTQNQVISGDRHTQPHSYSTPDHTQNRSVCHMEEAIIDTTLLLLLQSLYFSNALVSLHSTKPNLNSDRNNNAKFASVLNVDGNKLYTNRALILQYQQTYRDIHSIAKYTTI